MTRYDEPRWKKVLDDVVHCALSGVLYAAMAGFFTFILYIMVRAAIHEWELVKWPALVLLLGAVVGALVGLKGSVAKMTIWFTSDQRCGR